MKTCCRCGIEKQEEEFHKLQPGKIGGRCKPCEAARVKKWASANREKLRIRCLSWRRDNPARSKQHSKRYYESNKEHFASNVRRRQASQINATPPWSEREKILVLYKKAREWRMHVDHIVPLNHPLVCGLHVWHNLQLLSPAENYKKNNRTWPDMPGEELAHG